MPAVIWLSRTGRAVPVLLIQAVGPRQHAVAELVGVALVDPGVDHGDDDTSAVMAGVLPDAGQMDLMEVPARQAVRRGRPCACACDENADNSDRGNAQAASGPSVRCAVHSGSTS